MSETAWSINKAVINVPAEGTQLVRVDSIESGQSGENAKNPGAPLLKFKGVIVRGEDTDKSVFYTRSLLPQALGILGNDLAASGLFDGNENLPMDADELASRLDADMGGKVFTYEIKHREWNGQTRGEYRLVGPSNL